MSVRRDRGRFARASINIRRRPPGRPKIGEGLHRGYPEAPFAVEFSLVSEAEENWSLRSWGGFDVASVARSLGGGGHRAAGFRVARLGIEDERRRIESSGARTSASGDPEG